MFDLKSRRLELGLTLEQVGKLTGVGKSTVRKWETGYIENMGRDKIISLAKALKINPMDIIDPDEEFKNSEIAELNDIFKQLNSSKQKRVVHFAKIQLDEQQTKIAQIHEKSIDLPDTLAAHADDPHRVYSDAELADIDKYLDDWIDREENKKK